MTVRLVEQMEPLPGYRLIEKIGGGGFGEVWKTEAPGGLLKAIKFVRGVLDEVDGDASARQEFKALQRIKTLHHPFILSLERVDILDDRLMIVMELAERNLLQVLEDYQKRGLPGIPRDELLRYMRESAEALDLMNREYQLQHLDIKPQNLFVMRKHVKVADFGLAKDLDGTHAAMTSGITPTYAAPETFDGLVSHYCDQYSLAIVYQELLTGQRPFRGKSAHQLLLQHVSQPPDLSSLPEEDRPAVARALSKEPKARFASCREFIEALPLKAALPAPKPATAQPGPNDSTLPLPLGGRPRAKTPEHDPPARPRSPAPQSKSPPPAPKKRSSAIYITTWTCPRCGTPSKAAGLAFCSSCGYCAQLDRQRPAPSLAWHLLGEIPSWVWVLLSGIVCLGMASVLVDRRMPLNSEPRAVWGLAQLGVALLLIVAAQAWAVVLLAAEEGFDLNSMFLGSGKLWMHMAQRLPDTRWPIYLVSWGTVLAVCGACMGDMTYWVRAHAPQKAASVDVRRSLARLDEEAAREESRTIAVLQDRARQLPPKPATGATRTTSVQCVAVGYVPSEDGSSFRGVLMATLRDGKLVQTDVVDQGFTPENREDLFRRMQRFERSTPPSWWRGDAPERVVWLQANPDAAVVCEVECTRLDEHDGKPIEPRFKAVVGDQP
jgi:serine/threonine protein kinase